MSFLRTLAAALVALWSVSAFAGDPSLNVDANGVAIKGYDPVAYHTQNAAVKGSEAFTAQHEGATYHFANAQNRDQFQADPAKYAPAYGGYCAMGVAFGKKFGVEPEAFRVVDGVLYLNVNKDVQSRWEGDIPGNLSKANANWPAIAPKTAAELN